MDTLNNNTPKKAASKKASSTIKINIAVMAIVIGLCFIVGFVSYSNMNAYNSSSSYSPQQQYTAPGHVTNSNSNGSSGAVVPAASTDTNGLIQSSNDLLFAMNTHATNGDIGMQMDNSSQILIAGQRFCQGMTQKNYQMVYDAESTSMKNKYTLNKLQQLGDADSIVGCDAITKTESVSSDTTEINGRAQIAVEISSGGRGLEDVGTYTPFYLELIKDNYNWVINDVASANMFSGDVAIDTLTKIQGNVFDKAQLFCTAVQNKDSSAIQQLMSSTPQNSNMSALADGSNCTADGTSVILYLTDPSLPIIGGITQARIPVTIGGKIGDLNYVLENGIWMLSGVSAHVAGNS